MFSSPLQRAIARGLQPDGDLGSELDAIDDCTIRSREDAQAICEALASLPSKQTAKTSFSSPLYRLAGLFQDVEGPDVPAFEVLYEEGLPHLVRIFDAEIQHADEDKADDLLFVLKILGLYGSREGAEKVVEAARRRLKPDAYIWQVILSSFAQGHPQGEYVYESLSEPLPNGFIAVSLLDSANEASRKGHLRRHPFDFQAGWTQLRGWLADHRVEHFSYAHSATAALPFIANPPRDQLLTLAMNHVEPKIQMEAAWADGKLGRESGLEVLVRFCKDVNHAEAAQRYLAELDREDLIPAQCKEPAFAAKAEFAEWLAHPNELGAPPDELEIVDHRQLAWPPEFEPKPFWLMRYRVHDKTGLEPDSVDCGLVGSMTWCFFSYNMNERPPEDIYAIHAYWEMEHPDLIKESEVTDAGEYAAMLGQWQGARLDSPTITRIAEISPKLKIPGLVVAIATAKIEGEEGWIVLDGPRSQWYPQSEQPEKTSDSAVLKIHVGRQLLGFQDEPDRKKYLVAGPPRPEPRRIVEACEKLIAEVSGADSQRQLQLLGIGSLLSRHFDAYVEALVAIKNTAKPETFINVYGQFLGFAEHADASIREGAYDIFGVLGEHFDDYVAALISLGRSAEIAGLITLFAPYWQHDIGYGKLGTAAFKAGQMDVAEQYFLKLREESETYYRSEEMSHLAEMWHGRGESQQARELLLDCMQKVLNEIAGSEYLCDRQTFADEFRQQRSTYLRLFPDRESDLAGLSLPAELD